MNIYQDMPFQIQRRVMLIFRFVLIYDLFVAPVYILLTWPQWSYLIGHGMNAILYLFAGYLLFKKRYQLASDLSYFLYIGNFIVILFPMVPGPEAPEVLYRTTSIVLLIGSVVHISSFREHQVPIHYLASILSLVIRFFVLLSNTTSTLQQALFHLIFSITLVVIGTMVIGVIIDYYRDLIKIIEGKDKQIVEALTQVIQGYIPICANCKSIRKNEQEWKPIETFIESHSKDVKFTHGLCPTCMKKLYPEDI